MIIAAFYFSEIEMSEIIPSVLFRLEGFRYGKN